MADFQTSTHRANWIFTPQELAKKYEAANQRAREALEKYGATRVEVDVDGSLSYPEPQIIAKDKVEKHSRAKPLSIEEEKLLRVFFEQKIQDACQAFDFPHKIQATALLFFKRFYLQWSVMQHHPKNILLTCIYAACKIEENHVSAEELGKGISQDHQMILNNEMIVYQSLDFDLIVYAPYRSVEGFVNDMGEFCQVTNGQIQLLQNLHETARVEVDHTMLTDAPLLFPPGQLALAALRRSNEVHKVLDFERYLRTVLSRQHSAHTISELFESLEAIDYLNIYLQRVAGIFLHKNPWRRRMFKKLSTKNDIRPYLKEKVAKRITPTAEDLKHIDRKVKSCLDPSSHDKSKKRDKKSKHKSKKSSNEV